MANMVLVHKSSNKWNKCIDFTDFNFIFPNDPYPLPNIYQLIDGSFVYSTLIFIDTYSGYNQIKMDHMDASKITFMFKHGDYYYNVIPLVLKNTNTTYQRLMDPVFSRQIWQNLEFYINDMIMKT